YYYIGDPQEAKAANEIFKTNFSLRDGIGKVIRERQDWLSKAKLTEDGRDGLVFLIKPGPDAIYQQVIDALDETQINGVKRYMILAPDADELELMHRE